MSALDDSLARAHLDRLGVDIRPGEVDAPALAVLQREHLAAVPYENIDIVRGAPPGIDPLESVRRIVAGRGGYCYHLNGAFSALLEWLGVNVTRHRAGVQGRAVAEPPGASGNHLGLTVELDGSEWLVDVGLGDGPSEPLPLISGSHTSNGFTFTLCPSPLVAAGWRVEHDPRGWWILFDMAAEPAVTDDFTAMHTKLSTDPESGFVKVAVVGRRVGARLELLRGCVFTETVGSDRNSVDVESADEWWGHVIDRCGLAYGNLEPGERAAVWQKVRATHEAWDAAGRP
jgi:N-hydroxyarylamine O-acetyltransferase